MKQITRFIKKTVKSISKINIWVRLFVFLAILFVILNYVNYYHPSPEGFTQIEKFKIKKNDNLYDDFYCSIYDDLVQMHEKIIMKQMRYLEFLKEQIVKVLLILVVERHHVNLLSKDLMLVVLINHHQW